MASLYMDVQVPKAISSGLRLRGVDVLTAQEDGSAELADPDLLDRALVLNRVIFTFDQDFLDEAAHRQMKSIEFAGVIYTAFSTLSIGYCIADLELIAKVLHPTDLRNTVTYLPL